MEAKPHKKVLDYIRNGGATAEKLINAVGLSGMKDLMKQFEILTYLDLYVVEGEDGVYSVLSEAEYTAWNAKRKQNLDKMAAVKIQVNALKKLLKRDPEVILSKLERNKVKVYESYIKHSDLIKDKKSVTKLDELKLKLYDIKYAIADEELRSFRKSLITDYSLDIQDIPNSEINNILRQKIKDLEH